MVQRKVINKLSIQTDHVKSEKRLKNLGPSSPHHHDGKNKGGDLKKKMKKSGSIKRSGFESLESPIFTREIAQPGKPPTPPQPQPQKQSPIKGSHASPNYMKSTSSFDARKERSRVSSQTSIDAKSPKKIQNNSRLSSGSGHKPAKTITRTSSLKLVRTLTKFPSFKKPVRPSTKKCSLVVTCENLDVQRATCSSTLKDSKFPKYLDLSPGATESEGISVMKVCPYTYCSLNGHRHAPSPPLKCFLLARRRALKAQKSMKLGCLSPRRAKPSVGGVKEITLDEKTAIQEIGSNVPETNPLVQEDETEFFIEIYVGDTKDDAVYEDKGRQIVESLSNEAPLASEDDHHINGEIILIDIESAKEAYSSFNGDSGGQVVESVSHEAPVHAEMDSEDDLHKSGEVILKEMEVTEEACSPSPTQEEETPEFEVESPSLTDLDGIDSGTSDMEWEEGEYSVSLHDEVADSAQTNKEYDIESVLPIFKSDDISSGCFSEISAGDGLEEFFDEGGESSDSEGSYQNLGTDESIQDELVESAMEERDGNTELDDLKAAVISLAPKTEDLQANQSLKQELPIADAGNGTEEDEQDDSVESLIRIPNSDMIEEDNDELQLGAMGEDDESNHAFGDEEILAETPIHSQTNNLVEDQNHSEKDLHEDRSVNISNSSDSEDGTCSGLNETGAAESENHEVDEMKVESSTMLEPEESILSSRDAANTPAKTAFSRGSKRPVEKLDEASINLRIIRCKRPVDEMEELKEFNPRDPNYLPLEPDQEAEKVDLRHQTADERRNAEEWMLDYALQQAVTKLAPARKRKVALIVEAFENVMPMPKYESRLRHPSSATFAHARPIQACS